MALSDSPPEDHVMSRSRAGRIARLSRPSTVAAAAEKAVDASTTRLASLKAVSGSPALRRAASRSKSRPGATKRKKEKAAPMVLGITGGVGPQSLTSAGGDPSACAPEVGATGWLVIWAGVETTTSRLLFSLAVASLVVRMGSWAACSVMRLPFR